MATLIKDKNLFKFTIEEGKTYCFDTNTGELLGLRGKPIRVYPRAVVQMIEGEGREYNSLYMMYESHIHHGTPFQNFTSQGWLRVLNIMERLESIGYKVGRYDCRMLTDSESFRNECFTNFKKVSKYIKEHEGEGDLLKSYHKEVQRMDMLASANIQIDDHFTEAMADYIADHASLFNTADRIKAGAYYMARGLYNFYRGDRYGMTERLRRYFEYCDALQWNPKEKGGFIEVYNKAEETYNLRKEELDNITLKKNQTRFEDLLKFSTDDLEVVIPTTSKEFFDEGENQHNCVYRLYLPHCIKGHTNVVFVRRKNALNTSYITCEVSNSGEIVQYFRAYNTFPTEKIDMDFYHAYKQHLMEVWQK